MANDVIDYSIREFCEILMTPVMRANPSPVKLISMRRRSDLVLKLAGLKLSGRDESRKWK